jgi:hypothetical protein
VWKPWSFKYEVGKPSAFASPLELNVLYAGHSNRIAALASGYPTERISLSAPGCQVKSLGNGEYEVKPPVSSGGQRIALTVSGKNENGTSKLLSTSEFRVRPIPTPQIFLGSVSAQTGRISVSQLLGASRITAGFDASVPLTTVQFEVRSVELLIIVNGNPVPRTLPNGIIDSATKTMLRSCRSGSLILLRNLRVFTTTGVQSNVGNPAFMVQ